MAVEKSFLFYVYDDLVEAVKGITDKTFLGRPKVVSDKLNSFIVVQLPVNIRNLIAGGIERMPYTQGTFTVYAKAKSDSTLNPGIQTDLVDQVIKKFPISTERIAATRPRILMEGEDGYGFQSTLITFTIRGK